MTTVPLLLTVLLLTINGFTCLDGVGNSDEYRLYEALFQNYSSSVRPTKSWSDLLTVNLKINLRKIANVVENHQTVTLYVKFEASWTDTNLVWDSKTFGGVKSLVLPANKVWCPDLHLFNSAAEDDRIYPLNVEVFSNGLVKIFPINQLYAHCDFDFKQFPYDSQSCEFIIGTMTDKSKVNVSLVVTDTRIQPNPEWKYVSMSIDPSWSLTVPGTDDMNKLFNTDWSVTKFTVTMKRSSKFYVNLFIWPLVFILILATSIFILPPNCVERVTMGTLLILSLIIIMLMLDNYTPKSSTRSSVASRLLGFSIFMVTWATVVSTLIVGIDKDMFSVKRIPLWLKNLLLDHIGKLVCKKETLQANLGSNLVSQEEIDVVDTNSLLRYRKVDSSPSREVKTQSEVATASPTSDSQPTTSTRPTSDSVSDLGQAKTLLVLISNQLAHLRTRINDKDMRELNKKDWYLIACTLDRFCLLVYAVLLFLGLFFIFV